MLDVSERLVVIVGGGAVAVRKARGLLAAGAGRVRCVAPSFHPELPAEVQRVPERFDERHLDGAALVFAATDSADVNDRVVREANRRGVLVNRADADDENPGDFATPAIWREGAVTVTVSAGGSAALAAAIRDDLAARVDRAQVRMAELMQRLRPRIVASGLEAGVRRDLLRELASADAVRILGRDGAPGLRAWIGGRWPGIDLGAIWDDTL